jgi:trans-2,3-dihydro-3-hydroxyanthranilate isomerase
VPRRYPFIRVDVFTERIFGGNQLAVFLAPEGLSDAEMQAIACEMNIPETTFVFPPTRSECVARVRIFTPVRELPFAGHPTVGTTWVLAREGRLPSGSRDVVLEEGIGPVPVRLEGDLTNPGRVWMKQRDAEFGPELTDRGAFARALGLEERDLLGGQPVRIGSTGLPFLFIPLTNPEAVDRAQLDLRAISTAFQGERMGVFVFAPDPARGASRVYSRMFAGDTAGIPEDPATGSASGALGAYVAERGLVSSTPGGMEIISLQGMKMGRPSEVHIRLRLDDGRAREIEVGGGVVPVMEGTLTLPT